MHITSCTAKTMVVMLIRVVAGLNGHFVGFAIHLRVKRCLVFTGCGGAVDGGVVGVGRFTRPMDCSFFLHDKTDCGVQCPRPLDKSSLLIMTFLNSQPVGTQNEHLNHYLTLTGHMVLSRRHNAYLIIIKKCTCILSTVSSVI